MTFLKLKICTMKVDFIVSQYKNIQLIQKYTNRMSKIYLAPSWSLHIYIISLF